MPPKQDSKLDHKQQPPSAAPSANSVASVGVSTNVKEAPSEGKKNDSDKKMDAKDIAELKQICSPLTSVNAGEENADLFAMKAIIGDATVVGLGEGTHGTAEFFKMKHRLLEYLVVEMGFTVFALETHMSKCPRINEYVLGGNGNPKDFFNEMGWVWCTQEIFDMVEWMRRYNLTAKIKLQFTGFDIPMQRSELCEEIIERNLIRADFKSDSIDLCKVIAEIKKDKTVAFNPPHQQPEEQDRSIASKKLMENIRLLQAELEKHKNYLESKLGIKEYQWTIQNAKLLEQSVEFSELSFRSQLKLNARDFEYLAYRDKAMADNVLWLQKQNPGAKMVLWGHNDHINKQGLIVPKMNVPKPMGEHLAKKLGGDYRAIGFVTYAGNYTALVSLNDKAPRRDWTLSVPPDGWLEDSLKRVGYPITLLNLHKTNASEFRCIKGFEENEGHVQLRKIDACKELIGGGGVTYLKLHASYDGVIYIENTTASQPIKYSQPIYHNLRFEWSLFKKIEDDFLKRKMNDVNHKPYGSASIEFRNSAGNFKIDKEVFRVMVRRNLAIINAMGNNSKVTALYNAVKNRQYGKAVILLEEGKGIIDVTIKCTDKLQTVEELLLAQGTKVARGVLQKMHELNPPRQNTAAVVPTAKLH